ncbi:acyltransferase family protein [Clostridium lacusfryxellense]|uniref:acyltransferase family protein n=1 Tax=Clostridium lacusfryxellense TaxID=205328 RepID=UPI001C0E6762|nr:acyltransferase family protein [Clostridium lacusfryxellense]MBU3111445.1 acyltransferase family protein [Clostridium lacusfryxellense]
METNDKKNIDKNINDKILKMDDKGRVFFWDNLKVLLIVLVVVGHSVDFYTADSLIMRNIYMFIYTFHMPLFIFVSGYFSKTVVEGKHLSIEKVFSFLTLYFLMKLCFFIVTRYLLGNSETDFKFLVEAGVPWYLLAMSVWFCITYIIKGIKPVFVIIFSVIVGIMVGYYKIVSVKDLFSLSRILVFFPYFIIGYYFNQNQLIKILKCSWLKWISLISIIILIIIICLYGQDMYLFRGFLTGRNSFLTLKRPIFGGAYRLMFYGLSIILSLAILYITPKGETFVTKFGTRTLQVYFIHHLVLSTYHYYKLNDYIIKMFPDYWEIVYLFLAVGLALVLSLKIFEYPFKKIMDIKFKKILRD